MTRHQRYYSNINNYNKFLTTLDKNSKKYMLKKINKNINDKDVSKNEIDELITIIDNNFHINNTETNNKIISDYNPNKYIDFLNKELNVKIYKNINNCVTNNTSEKPRDIININVDINCISDILNLIHTYKDDPSIKYNIDIKSLHNIKEPLEELNHMIGMKELKSNIVDQILYFIQELHKNKNQSGDFLHTVIYGPPGTGKTEIAKIMGKIYSKIGILSNGTFKKVTRNDLIAGYLGQTALKTNDVIKECLGGVLFIDEAYSLGNPEKKDSFAKECIDTLCEALSDNKENLMVIIAGYEKELNDNFFSYNQGLDSRFNWRFKTDEYTYRDLYQIFIKKINDIGWEIDLLENVALEWFKQKSDLFRFYGRDIETFISKIKIAHSRRVFCKPENEKRKIVFKDLEKGLEIYLKNDYINSRKQQEQLKRDLYNTLYS